MALGYSSQPYQNPYLNLAQSVTGKKPVFNLPQNYNFNDLAGYEEARRSALGPEFQNQIGQLKTGVQSQYDQALKDYQTTGASRRASLASSLTDTAKKQFDLQNPSILEDLNRRGVFTSPTAVATAQAQALKELDLKNQDQLNSFDANQRAGEDSLTNQRLQELTGLDTSGVSANMQAQQEALDAGLNLRSGGLEAQLQGASEDKQNALAQSLAKQNSRNQLTGSLIGAGGLLAGGVLANKDLTSKIFNLGGSGVNTNPTGTGPNGIPLLSAQNGSLAQTATPGAATNSALGSTISGLGPVGGSAAVVGAGVGAAALSGAAQKKYGTIGGVLANPIGYQLNQAKNIGSKVFGGGSGNGTGSGNATATEQRRLDSEFSQLQGMKQAVQSGQLSPEEYQAQAQSMIDDISQRVGSLTSKSSAWANAINPNWKKFQDAGLVGAQNGQWVAI